MENDVQKRMQTDLLSLKGKQCWSVIWGAETGSLMTISLGDKRPRKRPLKNRTLTEDQRLFEGEYEFYLSCAWRIQDKKSFLCSSTSDNSAESTAAEVIRTLLDRKIVSCDISFPAGDLKFEFNNLWQLYIFSDQANEVDEYINYSFSTPESIFINGAFGEISVQERN